jgi:hypothetical protein
MLSMPRPYLNANDVPILTEIISAIADSDRVQVYAETYNTSGLYLDVPCFYLGKVHREKICNCLGAIKLQKSQIPSGAIERCSLLLVSSGERIRPHRRLLLFFCFANRLHYMLLDGSSYKLDEVNPELRLDNCISEIYQSTSGVKIIRQGMGSQYGKFQQEMQAFAMRGEHLPALSDIEATADIATASSPGRYVQLLRFPVRTSSLETFFGSLSKMERFDLSEISPSALPECTSILLRNTKTWETVRVSIGLSFGHGHVVARLTVGSQHVDVSAAAAHLANMAILKSYEELTKHNVTGSVPF